MSNISKITLPSNETYDLADSEARKSLETQSADITAIKTALNDLSWVSKYKTLLQKIANEL